MLEHQRDNMSTTIIRQCEPFLQMLAGSTPKRRKVLLQDSTMNEVKSVCEVCLNIIRGNIPLNEKQRRKLRRKKWVLRDLADSNTSKIKCRKTINQHGGFLGSAVAIALPFIAQLLAGKK